jgi:hypothetical protein
MLASQPQTHKSGLRYIIVLQLAVGRLTGTLYDK